MIDITHVLQIITLRLSLNEQTYRVAAIKQTMFERSRQVGNPLVLLLLLS